MDIEAIFHARKSLLCYSEELWIKKRENNFDITISAYDGAEICGSIGIFMLSLLSKHINKNHIVLYRDDGLAILTVQQQKNSKKSFKNYLKKKI